MAATRPRIRDVWKFPLEKRPRQSTLKTEHRYTDGVSDCNNEPSFRMDTVQQLSIWKVWSQSKQKTS